MTFGVAILAHLGRRGDINLAKSSVGNPSRRGTVFCGRRDRGDDGDMSIAREMGRDFRVLLAAQPTRGVDVGAIEFIHAQLRAARSAGKAVVLVSADLSEILALSDQIAVMYGGRFVIVMPRAEASEERLGKYMTGVERAA